MLCTSGFVDDVTFFTQWRQCAKIKDNARVLSSSPGGSKGAKSAVSDCNLFANKASEFVTDRFSDPVGAICPACVCLGPDDNV